MRLPHFQHSRHPTTIVEDAMQTLTLPYADDLLVTSGQAPDVLAAELRFLLAVKLFELHRLSIGKAAEFCDMGKVQFLFELGRLQVPVINLDDDQIRDELRDD